MKRRTMLQLSSIYAAGIPLLPSVGLNIGYQEQWQSWLDILISNCQVEQTPTFFHTGTLPKGVLAGFTSATNKSYFYNQHQYCFTVFEKKHPSVGLLELALPFWRLQSDGSWEKVACLSLFQLEALAKASVALSKTVDNNLGKYLLPTASTQTIKKADYKTAEGEVSIESRVQAQGVVTAIQVESKQSVIWQETFKSAHCLTCQS